MRALPTAAQAFIVSVIVVGAALLAWTVPRTQLLDEPYLFLALLLMSNVSSAFKVALLSASGSTLSVSYAVDFAALLLLGPNPTTVIAVSSAWSQCTFRMKQPTPLYRTLFSMASLVITVQAAGFAYEALGGVPGVFTNSLGVAAALVGAATTYFLFNTILISCAIALSTRQPIVASWNQNFLWSAPSYFVGAAVAFVTGLAVLNLGIWMGMLLIVAPVYFIYRTYKVYLGRIEDERRHVQEMSDLHLATIEALALAIDAKDQTAQSHIRRVQVYAAGLAKALGMSEQEIQGVKTAALLHDIGKLAVPEHILSKPGPLTQEEFQKIRIHPQVGAEIISAVPFPYPVAPLILSHHERWDGRGYPQGLKGDDIPLGARILTVVDYFDALTSDRPYHRAMDHDAALSLLEQEAGKALDPTVVAMFFDQLPVLAAEADRLEQGPSRRLTLEPTSELGRPAVGFEHESGKGSTVFEDIALAHKEIYALYEIAQSMGTSLGVADTMALISSKLSNLVPFAACALFLYDEEHDWLRCRFATGLDSELIGSMTIKSGYGLTGWVTRNRRPLVNARPSADFEAAGLAPTATSLQSAIVSPLIINDRLIGTLGVYQEAEDAYTDDHRRLLDRVCEQAAAVINNASVFERTQEDSLTDALTGLPNTRFMFIHLSRELARAERLKSEVALLVMDCDNFKEINDTHGHHVGDRALREVASVLRNGVRPYDICVRYAGDEFIVVLSGCGADEAERKRLELKRAMEDVVFEARPGRRLTLSISVGAAVYPHDGETYEALLASGDARMYRDKTLRKQLARNGAGRPGERGSSGIRLPMTPPDVTDVDIERARIGVLQQPVVTAVLIREAVRTTPRTRLLRLGLPDAAFAFRAGQAVMAGLAGSSSQSAYSIASAPSLASRGILELLVPADGAFGEAGLDPSDALGRSLTIDGPIGEFGVPADAEGAPLLLIGGGTGIAPLQSVALDRLQRAEAPPMVLVYSARTPDEFAFGDEFAALDRDGRMRVHQTVTRDERVGEWPWRSGRIGDALLAAALPGPEAWCLVCGPAGFVGAVTATLESLGVPGSRIVVER